MLKNVYLTDLIPDESPPELHAIRSSIHDKLISKGHPVTTNIDEAHLMIIFFTRGFIRRNLDILFNLSKLPLGHSVVFWDKKIYPSDRPTLQILLRLDDVFDDCLAEDLEGYIPIGDGTPEFQRKVRDSLRYMERHSHLSSAILNKYYMPKYVTDANSFVDLHVESVAQWVNPVSVDYSKLLGMESDLVKVAGLIDIEGHDRNAHNTRFLVISGCAQTHHITTMIKGLSMAFLLPFPPFFNGICYMDNFLQHCPQPPLSLAHGLLAHCFKVNLTDNKDFQKILLYVKEQFGDNLKVLFIMDGISSLDDLKEIRKLGHLCNQIGQGSMVILSTGLDIFRECRSNFESHDSAFLGYVEGAARAGQSAFMDNAAAEWRPFCVKLNDVQLGDVIEMAECRARGDMPKDPSVSIKMFPDDAKGVGEAAKVLSRKSNEEVVGESKRFKLT